MTNIFVEGIQGMGKSTLINGISKLLPKLHVCREGDYSPVDLAWCAWMSEVDYKAILLKYPEVESEILKNTMKEQEYYIVTYTKIKTEVLGFYKDLECYEIYNGRKSLSELKEIIFNRFRNFTETGYLFECAFFQNIVEDMILFHVLSDEEIIEFYRELFLLLDRKNFLLLYLYSDRLEENLQIIQRERCDEEGNEVWYQLMLDYIIKSLYGKKHGYSGEKDLINHLKHRQELELSIIKEVLGEHALILPAKEYDLEKIIAKITFSEKISYTIRKITSDEYEVLDDFLYEAIFIPEGVEAPPKEIINAPELQVYVEKFGSRECDICFVAEMEPQAEERGKKLFRNIIGAVWVRIMDDYGHIEDGVPSFAISLYEEYRGLGIGTALMKQMLAELMDRGYRKTSLAVQKANYAVKMYLNVGFQIIDENEEEYIMVCEL